MKRFIILIFLSVMVTSEASALIVGYGRTFSAGSAYSDVIIHMNGDGSFSTPTYTLDTTETGPAATITSASQATNSVASALIGSNGFEFPTTGDAFIVGINQAADKFQYAFIFRFTGTITQTSTEVIGFRNTTTSRYARIGFEVGATNEVSFSYRENSGVYTVITTSSASLATDTTYILQVIVDQTAPLRGLYIYNSTGTTLIDSIENTSSFTEPSAGYTEFLYGSAASAGLYIDNIMVSNGSSTRDFVNDEISGTKMILRNNAP